VGSKKIKKFTITFGPKKDSKFAEYNSSEQAIYVNGRPSPIIHLYKNTTYIFVVDQKSDDKGDYASDFMFTEHPVGGSEAKPMAIKPLTNGSVSMELDKDTPRLFYYHSSKHGFQGCAIWAHK